MGLCWVRPRQVSLELIPNPAKVIFGAPPPVAPGMCLQQHPNPDLSCLSTDPPGGSANRHLEGATGRRCGTRWGTTQCWSGPTGTSRGEPRRGRESGGGRPSTGVPQKWVATGYRWRRGGGGRGVPSVDAVIIGCPEVSRHLALKHPSRSFLFHVFPCVSSCSPSMKRHLGRHTLASWHGTCNVSFLISTQEPPARQPCHLHLKHNEKKVRLQLSMWCWGALCRSRPHIPARCTESGPCDRQPLANALQQLGFVISAQ